MQEEGWVVAQVASPQVSWVLKETVEPLESRALDPFRTVSDTTGVEVKCGTDSKHEGSVEQREITAHELFLLRRADADPDDVRPQAIDGSDEFFLLYRRHGTEGRCVCANDLQEWIAGDELFAKLLRNSIFTATE